MSGKILEKRCLRSENKNNVTKSIEPKTSSSRSAEKVQNKKVLKSTLKKNSMNSNAVFKNNESVNKPVVVQKEEMIDLESMVENAVTKVFEKMSDINKINFPNNSTKVSYLILYIY